MKKHIMGLIAIALGVAFSAFTKPSRFNYFADSKFVYDQTSFTSIAAVENPANWDITINSTYLACTTDDELACGLQVSDVYYHLNASGIKVLNTVAVPGNDAGDG